LTSFPVDGIGCQLTNFTTSSHCLDSSHTPLSDFMYLLTSSEAQEEAGNTALWEASSRLGPTVKELVMSKTYMQTGAENMDEM